MRRVALVGAGYIAQLHAEVLRELAGVQAVAVVDPNVSAAERLAAAWGIPRACGSTDELLELEQIDCAHILTPPATHRAAAEPLLRAGHDVLLEKPAGASSAECDELRALAGTGSVVGVNQNFVMHPAFRRLRNVLESGRVGRLVHVGVQFNMPLRQLAAGQLGHWMFREPQNLLLEQAVHPLSQILAIAGEFRQVSAQAGDPLETPSGGIIFPTWQASLKCARATAQLYFSVGQNFPFFRLTAVCDDGAVTADIERNVVIVHERTKWPPFADGYLDGRRASRDVRRQSAGNAAGYLLSLLKLRRRSDPFYLSMRDSIGAFHRALDRGAAPELDLEFGARLVSACEEIAIARPEVSSADGSRGTGHTVAAGGESIFLHEGDRRRSNGRHKTNGDHHHGGNGHGRSMGSGEIAVLGGTGFIGRHVVRRLVAAGRPVRVMARNLENLPDFFADPLVTLIPGNVMRRAEVERAIGTAPVVINLAHGGGGTSWDEIRKALVGSAVTVAEVCLERKVRQLLHISSIAALFLGRPGEVISGTTPPDPDQRRADYARAKAEAERQLLDMQREAGLPVCILRPGVVVGAGGSPLHSGLGAFNNPQHCLGWNSGRNPLPFVLVEDVAEAIVLATTGAPQAGRCYNLVGDVRLSARDYIAELGRAQGRPLRFHAQPVGALFGVEIGKWLVKRAIGRNVSFPSYRDLQSRGMTAQFDCTDAKRELRWEPVGSRDEFIQRAIHVHSHDR